MTIVRQGYLAFALLKKATTKTAIIAFFIFVTFLFSNLSSSGSGMISQSPLFGKKIAYNGDSICSGAGYAGGYAKIIKDLTACAYENRATGGGTLAITSTADLHLCADVQNMAADADLVCFEGGINDFWGNVPIGSLDKTSTTRFTNTLDTTTLCGALESIFRQAIQKWTGVPICFIITHKIQNTEIEENRNGDSWTDFHNAIVEVCEKYSIPYLDLFLTSGMNCQINAISAKYTLDGDGTHPNYIGYETFYVPQILKFLESLIPS